MRKPIKVQWPRRRENNFETVLNTVKNYIISKNNIGIKWWFNEVTIGEAEQSLDLQDANRNLIYTNWDFYVSTKGWMV
jgi:hypothetical protein